MLVYRLKTEFCRNALGAALLCALGACDVETFDDVASSLDTPDAPPAETTPDPTPDPTPAPPSGGLNPVFSEIQSAVFTPNCASASCHSGGNPAADLNLDAVNSYADLVGIASSQQAGVLRVEAGDADNSYLIQKLEGTAATGNVMPPSGGLPQSTVDIVRQWIADGATDDRVSVAAPIKLRSMRPAPGSVLSAAPASIVAGFDRELNAATVDAYTVIVESVGGTATPANAAQPVARASVRLLEGNPMSAVIDLDSADLGDGTYRVRLSGDSSLAIEDLDGNVLDGDGDGVAGGDYVAEFVLDTGSMAGPSSSSGSD